MTFLTAETVVNRDTVRARDHLPELWPVSCGRGVVDELELELWREESDY